MEALAVDLQLLRAVLLSDINLTLGRELMARVASNQPGQRGSLSIAGMLVEAELPDDLKEGQEVRLQVRELTADRVVLGLQDQGAQQPPPPLVPALLQHPQAGTGEFLVRERHESSRGGGDPEEATHTLALRYDAPAAGPVDMYFVLTPGVLHLQVTVAAGDTFDAASRRSQELDDALTTSTGRTATVNLIPRFDPIDLYA